MTWRGCVPMPEGLAANSVASFADGSIVATVLFMPGTTFADAVVDRKPTGAVFEWSPGDAAFTLVEGTQLPANNGIEVSADGREIYVASSGLQTVVAFSHSNPARQLRTTRPLPFTPDNVHMGPDGRLLTAGMANDVPECGGPPGPQHDIAKLSACPRPTIAVAIDPATMRDTVIATTNADAEVQQRDDGVDRRRSGLDRDVLGRQDRARASALTQCGAAHSRDAAGFSASSCR